MRVHEIGDEAKMNVKSELAKNISRGQRYFVNALWAYREVIDIGSVESVREALW